MKIIFIYIVLLFSYSSFAQEIFAHPEKKDLYRSAVEYSFDEVLDDGAYTFIFENIDGFINIAGHPGSGSHLIIDKKVRAFNNKNALSILKNSNTDVFHDLQNKIVTIKKTSERYDHKIMSTIDLHIPINTNIIGSIKRGDIIINELRGSIELHTESVDTDLKNLFGSVLYKNKGGNLFIEKTKGTLDINLISGDIKISETECDISIINENGNITLTNINGNINISTTLGENEISNLNGSEAFFEINVGNLTINNSSINIITKIDIGNITINKLKGSSDLFTAKGNIIIQDITGDIIANSNYGKIIGTNIFGGVKANSEFGNLNIVKSYNSFLPNHSIDLKTNRGSIFLSVPSELPYKINAICNNQNSKDFFSSEIPLDEQIFDDKLIAKGKIKAGTINCNIYSNHGEINIRSN